MPWYPGNERRPAYFTDSAIQYACAREMAIYAVDDARRRPGFPAQFAGDAVTIQLQFRPELARTGKQPLREFGGIVQLQVT